MNAVTRNILLLLAIFGGFWMRWDGLDWGRKSGVQFHRDEGRFVKQAYALDHDGALLKSYVFGFGEAIHIVHAIAPSRDYARIGRGLSLASGMLLLVVVFAIARVLKLGPNAAAVACALTSLNTMCVIHSHYGTADMAYVLLLYLFALVVLRGWIFIAAIVAGLAMATKFGIILVPSLIWLACGPVFGRNPHRLKAGLQAVLLLLIATSVFLAAQGFTFDGKSIRMILLSAEQDEIGGFEHQKWQNIITYLGVSIRSLGIPVFVFAAIGCARVFQAWRGSRSTRDIDARTATATLLIAFLPFALHAVGLLAINTAFPRHFLPLVPLLLIAAAYGIEKLPRLRAPAVTLCLGWSVLLAWSDGRVFVEDPREKAYAWLRTRTDISPAYVWSDSRFTIRRPSPKQQDVRDMWQVRFVVLSEAWTCRFERSEWNPLRAPNERQLYHVSPDAYFVYCGFKHLVVSDALPERPAYETLARELHRLGTRAEYLLGPYNSCKYRREVFRAEPLKILPEQILYDAAWGSFEKLAGKCVVYDSVQTQIPTTRKSGS
ncbi:MAG: hypothetical protein DMF34_03365 [Verrucomicrobia bacterium]|nr:MAG: hypothetical protein DMF34_03365 [Verrucomicrobiota bacterium]